MFELAYKSSYGCSSIYFVDFEENIELIDYRDDNFTKSLVSYDIVVKTGDFNIGASEYQKSELEFLLDHNNKCILIDDSRLFGIELYKEYINLDDNVYDEQKYEIKYSEFSDSFNKGEFKYDKVVNVNFIINQYDLCILVYEFNENINLEMDYDGPWDPYQNDDFVTKYTFISKTVNVTYCKVFNIVVPCNDWGKSNNNFVMYENKIAIDDIIFYEYKIYLNVLLYIYLILDKRIFFLEGLEGYYEIVPNERDRTYDWKMMKLKDTKAYKNYLKFNKIK
jgi:hypothetical protein